LFSDMLDRVPRPVWILSLLALVAFGLALGTNAVVARLMIVDAGRLASVREGGPDRVAGRSGDPDRGDAGVVADAQAGSPSRRSTSFGPRRLNYFQDPIVRRNLFNSEAGPTPPGPDPGPRGPEVPKSEIDAVLISTAVADDPVWSTATLSVSSKSAEPYRIGDALADATVIDIRSPWLDVDGEHHPARVIVLRDGKEEYIDAGGKPKAGARRKPKKDDKEKPVRRSGRHTWDGIKDLGDGKYSIDQSEIDYALSNLDKLSREARVVPNFSDGQTNGWKVFSIRRNSALRKMGLKNNDVLTAVNGMDLSDTEKALEVYSRLQSDKSFSLEILRNGEPMTLEYNVQ
jgi:general secretion pathway protein C